MMKYKDKIINSQGQLYIVPTPIGNLSDITQRALTVLKSVDLIAVENALHTSIFLRHFAINANLLTFNAYNERKKSKMLITKLKKSHNIALVSDSGTPLINDPGYCLVRTCHQEGIRVIPLPGPCAAVTALSAAGLPSNRFCYEGFLPAKSKNRCNILKLLENETRTLIFYESTHRLIESLEDIVAVWGKQRYVVMARELTKIWENIYGAPVGELLKWIKKDENRRKGEIVLIVEGYKAEKKVLHSKLLHTMTILRTEFSLKRAIQLTSKIYGVKKNALYKYALKTEGKLNF